MWSFNPTDKNISRVRYAVSCVAVVPVSKNAAQNVVARATVFFPNKFCGNETADFFILLC